MTHTASRTATATDTATNTARHSSPWARRTTMLWGGLLLGAASFGPSLVPRPWVGQAIAMAVSVLAGMLLGWVVWLALRLARRVIRRTGAVGVRTRIIGWMIGWFLVAAACGALWVWGRRERGDTARLVGMEPPALAADVKALAVGAGIAVAIVLLIALIVWLWRGLAWAVTRLSGRRLGRLPSRVVAGVMVAAAVVAAVQFAGVPAVVDRVKSTSNSRDAQNPAGVGAPTSALRSGGPGSAQPWSALGFEGRKFVSGGPDATKITQVTGAPAKEPIRAYAGRDVGGDIDRTVEVAVAELRRTGGLDRRNLLVVTTTGRGWVDEFIVASFEYFTGGDCATVAIQYGNYPSWVALVGDRDTPSDAGRKLFQQVEQERAKLPADKRPRLFAAGVSLGSFGGQAAFSSPADMLARVDGALWMGTPLFTPVRQQLTQARQPGSPELLPEVDGGRHVRFAALPDQLTRRPDGTPYGEWAAPRVAYLQHASDPVGWWDSPLLTQRPDWMRERVGADLNPSLRWVPGLTYWQTTIDVIFGVQPEPTASGGHGHLYREEVTHAWAGVLGVSGDQVARVAEAI